MVILSDSSAPPASSHIAIGREVTLNNFMQEVLQPSMEGPVLLFFWSPASPNCKNFGTLVEKHVAASSGALKLARVNIDRNPEIVQQFRVQSVPTLYVILQGQPVDGVAGIMTEAELKKFLERYTGPDPMAQSLDEALAQAEAMLAQGDTHPARQIYSHLMQAAPEDPRVIAGVAQCMMAEGEIDSAISLLARVAPEIAKQPAILRVKTALDLAKKAQGGPDMTALQATLAKSPEDHETRLALANQLFAFGRQEEAMDELLAIFRKNREWNDGEARKQLLTYFEALGPTHPLTMSGRRKLSSLLFS